ncbi:MAG: hypothetical protein IPJ31_15020 [Bacteroidetes bacterium]|nr:hypothetical protein [Bacteroidota bacterium]
MANKSRFVIASGKIKSHFHEGKRKIYSKKELVEIFYQNRILWNLPGSMYPDAFIEKLLSSEILIKREIHFEGYITIKERYMVLDTSAFEVALSLMGKSYLSHYTAVYLHGLTKQIPKTIYVLNKVKNLIQIES